MYTKMHTYIYIVQMLTSVSILTTGSSENTLELKEMI